METGEDCTFIRKIVTGLKSNTASSSISQPDFHSSMHLQRYPGALESKFDAIAVKSELATVNARMKNLEAENLSLKEELRKLKANASSDHIDLQADFRALLTRYTALEQQEKSNSEKIQEMERSRCVHEQRIASLVRDKTMLSACLDKEKEKGISEVAELKWTNERLKVSLQSANMNLESLKERLDTALRSRDEALLSKENHNRQSNELAAAEIKIKELEGRLAQVVDAESISRVVYQELPRLKEMERNFNRLVADNKALRATNQNVMLLQEQLSSSTAKLAKTEQAVQELSWKDAELQEYRRRLTEISEQHQACGRSQDELQGLRERNLYLLNKNGELELLLQAKDTTIKQMREEIEDVKQQFSDVVDHNPAKTKVLRMNINTPLDLAMAERRSELEVLRLENDRLKDRLRTLEQSSSSYSTSKEGSFSADIPSSKEFRELKVKLADAEKYQSKLKEVYAQKSSEFKEAIFSLLGYAIEDKGNFYHLVSRYADSEDDILAFEISTSEGISLLDTEYVQQCRRLISKYMCVGSSIPAFLGALTLELFSRQTMISNNSAFDIHV